MSGIGRPEDADETARIRDEIRTHPEVSGTVVYLLFAYPRYYPSGGMHDCAGVYRTVGEAFAAGDALTRTSGGEPCDHWQVVRLDGVTWESLKIVHTDKGSV